MRITKENKIIIIYHNVKRNISYFASPMSNEKSSFPKFKETISDMQHQGDV